MDEIELRKPTIEYENQVKELVNETYKYDNGNPDMWAGYSAMQKYANYSDWLEKEKKKLNYKKCNNDMVHADTYFSIRKKDNKIVGVINIRHELTEYMKNYCGHIGYSIRYSERKKGYGQKQLILGIQKCLEIPLKEILIICREGNFGSEKTIISCGGIYEDTRFNIYENSKIKRYWIKI